MLEYLHQVWDIMLALAPWLFLGAAVSGIIHVLLPGDFVQRHLTGRGSIIKSVVLGVPLPLCSCGVIPAGLGLKKDGASDGASVGFLISTPQTGVDSILVAAGFFGWPFALFKVGAAAITGVAGGWLTERFGGDTVAWSGHDKHDHSHGKEGWREALDHGEDLIRSIWGWLLIGVIISAAITTWIPTDGFQTITAWGPVVTLLTVLMISLPLYVCATASVPIAASLVAGGFPTGAALVFLMAGPATNVATIGAIQGAFGKRVLSIYLGTIIAGSIGLGILFDAFFETAPIAAMGHEHGEPWWATVSAIALSVLLFRYTVSDALRWRAQRKAQHISTDQMVVAVSGLTCGGCVSKLETALKKADKVDSAVVTLEPAQAVVSGNLSQADLHRLIEDTGFQVVTSA